MTCLVHILLMFDKLSSSLPQPKFGTLRVIAVCILDRSTNLAEIPTVSTGFAAFTSSTWLLAPPEVPDVDVTKISNDVVDVFLKTAQVQEFLAHSAEAIGNTPQEMVALLDRERALRAGVIEKAELAAPK
jgi:tripartite-type tricarboxylate transporter receptor subunit TctC